MKKIRLILTSLILFAAIFCLVGCGGEEAKEANAEIITIYLRDFEDWSNDYFMDAIDKYNENLNQNSE